MNPAHRKLFEKKYGATDAHQPASPQPDIHSPYQNGAGDTLDQQLQHAQPHFQPATVQPVGTTQRSRVEELSQHLNAYNSSKLAIRPTTDCFPSLKKLQKTIALPLSVVIQPYASVYTYEEFPTANFGATNPIVRCEVCRSYVNPFTEFTEASQRFKCNICGSMNVTPQFYISAVDANGQRVDKLERPELCCGTFDIKAGTDYMARPPMPPIYFFVIDVSQKAVEAGSLEMFSNVINEMVTNDWFWGDVRTKIGFLVYDSNVHIFNLDAKLKRPQVITLTDIANLSRLPLPENLLVTLSDCKELVKTLVKSIPTMFANNKDNGSNLYNAVRVSNSILRASGGRMYIIQTNPNIVSEPDLSIKTPPTQDKKILMVPSTPKLMELTPDMHQNFISCNLFIISNTFKNSITLMDLAKHLNGDVHYFPEGPDRAHKFYYELKNSLMKDYTWETVFRVRVSQGWAVKKIYGNYSIKFSNDLLSIPNCDDTKALVYDIELDDEVSRFNVLYFQTALLYTNSYGERRIRVVNYGIPLSDSIQDIEQSIDPQAMICWMLRSNLDKLYSKPNITQIRDECLVKARMIYNQIVKTNRHKDEPIPESMITFSLGILGILKHPLFVEQQWQHNMETDMRNALRIKLNMLNIDETMLYFVPYLFAVHRLVEEGDVAYYDESGVFVFPQLMNLSMSALSNTGIYLMDDGSSLYMLIGSQADPTMLRNLFGISSTKEVESLNEDMLYHNSSDPLVERLYYLITELRNRKTDKYAYLHIIKEGEGSPAEMAFYSRLIEDKLDIPNSYKMSYADFIKILSTPVVGNDKI